MIRAIVNLCLLLAIIFLPFWIYLPLLVLALAVMPYFLEIILFGFLIDVLYGAGAYSGISFDFPFAIYALLGFFVSSILRSQLRLNV